LVRGGLLVLGNKNKKEELLKKDHPSQPKMKEGLHVKNHMEGSQCLHHIMNYADASLGSGAAMPSPPPSYMAPNDFHGASSQPMQVKEVTSTITLQARIHHTRPLISTTER
jgi:hypothetical protein